MLSRLRGSLRCRRHARILILGLPGAARVTEIVPERCGDRLPYRSRIRKGRQHKRRELRRRLPGGLLRSGQRIRQRGHRIGQLGAIQAGQRVRRGHRLAHVAMLTENA